MTRQDPSADRMRRMRAHRNGDHSRCLPQNCGEADGLPGPKPPDVGALPRGTVADAVLDYVDLLDPGEEGGGQEITARLALKVAADIDAGRGHLPHLVASLRGLMGDLRWTHEGDDLVIDIKAKRRERLEQSVGEQPEATRLRAADEGDAS